MKKLLLAGALVPLVLFAEVVQVADSVRDAQLDVWGATDVAFCREVMSCVLTNAGVEAVAAPFGDDGVVDPANVEVICSAFRTPALLEHYDFPLQPIGEMHYALYATPARAASFLSIRIADWPHLVVGYSPVSQGQRQNDDRTRFFEQTGLAPDYREYPTSAGAVAALTRGEIDALFLYTPDGKRPEGLVEIIPIGKRNVYFAVRRDRPDLFARLCRAYRDCYIDHIDRIDRLREEQLGVPRPTNRVRVAAFSRAGLFEVSPDGERTGAVESWLKAVGASTGWTFDYVYGGFDESLSDVMSGRLDLIGGVVYTDARRERLFYPHTLIGLLRVCLWTRDPIRFRPGEPASWEGMRVGMLAGARSTARAKDLFAQAGAQVVSVEYASATELHADYFAGKLDACVDIEMPALANETVLIRYSSNPMFLCASARRPDLFEPLNQAIDAVFDDFPKYKRLIAERYRVERSERATFSFDEIAWLDARIRSGQPVAIDFSSWPFPVADANGRPTGFVADFLALLARRTGLVFVAAPQTDLQTAKVKFLRGETDLWIPYPEVEHLATYSATHVFDLPVLEAFADLFGADPSLEMELFAARGAPPELVSILHKVAAHVDADELDRMFLDEVTARSAASRFFGLTADELKRTIGWTLAVLLVCGLVYGVVMIQLLRRQTQCARRAAVLAENHAQAKTRFLAVMSHELRTPLNAVIGFAEFLARGVEDAHTRAEYTHDILVSANALLALINDILDLSKLEAGALQMRVGRCDMNQLLRELPAIFGYRVSRHGVQLRIDVPDEPLPIVALLQQGMRQLLLNLVGNAAKFTDAGAIDVKARWTEATRTLHLEVSDTGCGLSAEKLARLFDPFVQDIGSRAQAAAGEIKGTGLGLPIVKRLVDAAGGTIAATSELGKGTTFTVDIPGLAVLERPVRVPDAPVVVPAAALAPTPVRVLVVDDMAMNRKILGIHLRNLKVPDVRFAENGVQALAEIQDWTPDLVLTDMWMPEMDGAQLAAALHKDARFAHVPIVAVTADVDVDATFDMSRFAQVIAKPITTAKLTALFNKL